MEKDKVQHLRNEPLLRFSEFKEGYHTTIVGREVEIVGGGTPSTSDQSYWNGGIDWFTPSEIGKNKYCYSSERKITEKGLKKSSARLLPEGSILLSTRATIGESSICAKEVTTNQGFQSIVQTHNDNEYFYYLLKTKVMDMFKYSTGSTFREISKGDLSKIKISIPNTLEQRKIAVFFESVDKKIELLNEKLENLKLFKKGFLMKYFAELENNGYEEVLLNDISTFSKGKGLSKSDLTPLGSNKCVLYGELYTRYKEIISGETSMTNTRKDKMILSTGDEVLLPSSTTTTAIDLAKATAITESGIILGGDINILQGDFDNIFMAYYLSYFKKRDIARFGQGITIVHLYNSHLKELLVRLPELNEQKSFSKKVQNFDNRIFLTIEKLETYIQFKKGLLQKMFV